MEKIKKTTTLLEYILLFIIALFILYSPFSKTISKKTIYFAFLIWLIIGIIKFRFKVLRELFSLGQFNKYIIVFLAAIIISMIFSLNLHHSQSILFERYFYYFICCLIGYSLGRSHRNLFFLSGILLLAGIILSIGGIKDYLFLYDARLVYCFRRVILFTPQLVLYLPLSLVLVLFARNKFLKIGGLISSILLYPCLLWNASRAALIAILIAISITFFLKNKKLIGISLIFFLIITALLLPARKTDIYTRFSFENLGDRLPLWKSALKIFSDFPLSGAGLGMYEKLLYKYGPPEGYSEGKIHLHAHNTYLELLAEMGIFGFLAFIWLLFGFLKTAFQSIKSNYQTEIQAIILGLTSSIISVLVLALTATVIIVGFQDAGIFWLILGVIVGASSSLKIAES